MLHINKPHVAPKRPLPHHARRHGRLTNTNVRNWPCFVRMSAHDPEPAVRFESQVEEIAPEHSLEEVRTLTGHDDRQDLSPEAKQELRSLAVTMQACRPR